jgi:3-oxoadipate enol-lactonase
MNSLVLLHGYPFDHTMWDGVIRGLGTQRKIIAPNLRGFGSPPGSVEPSLDSMADDVATKIDGPAFVAGFSMGGYVALALAERHPDKIAGLALINSQAAADTEEVRNARRSMIQKVLKDGTSAATEAALPKLFSKQNPAWTAYPLKGAECAGVAGITWALEAMARRPDRTSVVSRLGGSKPILIVHSMGDKFIPVDRARALANSVGARYVEIEGAGHGTPIEVPERVADALASWLDER